MDSLRRKYLAALDIDVWERRSLVVTRAAAANAPAVAAVPRVPAATDPVTDPASTPVVIAPHAATPVADPSPFDASADPVAVEQMPWQALEQTVSGCTRCGLHRTRTQTVFGVGNRQAEWMVIGEAPGADEDAQGEPFVGRAGQLLNAMLRGMGFAREQVFIANILKCRPPNNRDPTPEETRSCLPYLFRQIALVNPRLILCVGRIAAQTLLSTDTPIGKLRGKVHRLPTPDAGVDRPVIVTYHPAYLLRSPGEKRKAWQDLLLGLRTSEELRS